MSLFHVCRISGLQRSSLVLSVLQPTIIPSRNNRHRKVKRLPKRYIVNAPLQGRVDSLSSRGFLRNLCPYTPRDDVGDKVASCIHDTIGKISTDATLSKDQKFKVLTSLGRELNYVVPNSILYKIKTIGDIFKFYCSPVDTTVPYDRFKDMQLPPNLHILYDYHRFNPQTDTKFGGVSAFPRSSTLVTGLKEKKKYAGFTAEPPWMDI